MKSMIRDAVFASVRKLSPRTQLRNPVMFVVYIGAMVATALTVQGFINQQTSGGEPLWFTIHITFWLWFTVLFANFAEAIAEGKGRAQAETLRSLKREIKAKKLKHMDDHEDYTVVAAALLKTGDFVIIGAGEFIPADGQVMDGIASVDESAITGESAPVIRESGGDNDSVTGGTRVLSDWIVVRVTANPGESFIERMVALIEGAKRQKTPNEIALGVLLAAMTLMFLITMVTLLPYTLYGVEVLGQGTPISTTILIALLVCLAPTTIGGLLSAIGIAGMNRLLKANIIATSGRAVEAAGDISVLLLDKTGTITHGNRQAAEFYPAPGITAVQLAESAMNSSLADKTPEGKSIVALAKEKYALEPKELPPEVELVPFSAETRISGIRGGSYLILKGACDAIEKHILGMGSSLPAQVREDVERIARSGGTPLVVADHAKVLGTIHLKDVVKHGIKERLAELRKMGIKSVMITGDNPLTAAAIAAEAGVDDYLAQATPEAKLKLIRAKQAHGDMVAMVGDGTNDAPALAQSDVAVAMNSGTQAAKEAANMVDLDSDPTKLIEVVEVGKQLLMTRGALTTFSLANDVAKYFATIPASFVGMYPALKALDIMSLGSPYSAILSAIIFNALMIVFLIPLALKGVKYIPAPAGVLLRRNLLMYGLGGIAVPFVGIKVIDMMLIAVGLV